jgi:hypothetical protein
LNAIIPYSAVFPAGSRGILVVANGSRRTKATAKLVAQIHTREGVRVHVAAVQCKPSGYAGRFLRRIDVRKVLEDAGRRSMAPLCAELDALGVPYRTHIEIGPWLAGIARLARELGCARVLAGSAFDAWLIRSALRGDRRPPTIRAHSAPRLQ